MDTNYKLGTKRVFIPNRVPETIIEEFMNLGFEIIRDGITIMGAYIGTPDYMNQMLEKETNDILKLIRDIKSLTIPDENGCQLTYAKAMLLISKSVNGEFIYSLRTNPPEYTKPWAEVIDRAIVDLINFFLERDPRKFSESQNKLFGKGGSFRTFL